MLCIKIYSFINNNNSNLGLNSLKKKYLSSLLKKICKYKKEILT